MRFGSTRSDAANTERSRQPLALVAIVFVALVVLVRLLGPPWRGHYELLFPDSFSYVEASKGRWWFGPWWPGFWFADRAPGYPLLLWVIGGNPRRIAVTQSVLALLAWGWLWVTMWRSLRNRWVAGVAIGILVLVAIETRWVFWHTLVLTESLSATTAIAAIAGWWRWGVAPSQRRVAVAVGLTVAWMSLRDSNAFAAGLIAGLVIVVAGVRRLADAVGHRPPWEMSRAVVAAAVAVCAFAAYTATAHTVSDRGEVSFHNNMGLRFLGDPRMLAYFEAHGLPTSPALTQRTGSDAWADGEAFLQAPALDEYRTWAEHEGRVWAAVSLVTHADWYVDQMWDWMATGTGEDLTGYDSYTVAQRFPERPLRGLGPADSRTVSVVWAVLVGAALGVLFARSRRMAWVMTSLLGVAACTLYLSFTGDAIEVGRHLVGSLLMWSVLAVCSLALAVDELVARRE